MNEFYKSRDLKDLPNEIWKDIPNYEGFYQASNYGRLKGIDRIVKQTNRADRLIIGRILSQSINKKGYLKIKLSKNSKPKEYRVARIIGFCHIPNPYNKLEINHIDGNKLNNHYTNLEWCTRAENNAHAIRTGLLNPFVSIENKPTRCIEFNKEFISAGACARYLQKNGYPKASNKNISSVCLGRQRNHWGLHFEYIE